ncbi:hypothetical protein Rctr85_033 [Virus Rctr85]|nr:hypothetical protein Rctr85_033 [Virus Rctr85]
MAMSILTLWRLAERVAPTVPTKDFTTAAGGARMPRRQLWSKNRAWPVVCWSDDDYVVVLSDGRLFRVMDDWAIEVKAQRAAREQLTWWWLTPHLHWAVDLTGGVA